MGQDFSWPCTSREEERKMCRRRYIDDDDDDNIDGNNDYNSPDPVTKQNNMKKIEELIPTKDYLKEFGLPDSTNSDDLSKSLYPYTDESMTSMDDQFRLQVICQKISNFPKFAERQTSFANFKLLPSYITPHLDQERAIVIMQPVEDIEYIEGKSQKMHRFISKSMDIKDVRPSACYQYFTKLLKDASLEGLIYIGYYVYNPTEYVFCFYAPTNKINTDRWLEFEALETVNASEITKKIEQRNKMNSRFKGMISIKDNDSVLRKHLCFLIFEKQAMKKQKFFIVPYANDLLNKDTFDNDLTEKIEAICEDEESKIDLAGLISNPESDELYIVFSSYS